MDAGNYDTMLQRLTCTRTKNPTNGDLEDAHAPGDWYWCRLEYTGSSVRDDWDGQQTAQDVTIGVRNFPALSPLDQFRDADGRVYEIESIRPGDDEWVCSCFSRDGDA